VATIGIALGLVFYLALLIGRCVFRVEESHRALLTSFGAIVHDASGRPRTYGPGLHKKAPWHHVHDVSLMEQNLDLTAQDGGRTAMAEDGTVLRFDSVLRYTPVERELDRYLFGMRSRKEHIMGLAGSLLRNEIANIRMPPALVEKSAPRGLLVEAGSYALVRRERQQLNGRIAEFFSTHLSARYGIEFRAVDLTEILPPDELADALNAVLRTQSEAEALYARAEAESSQRLLGAERGVEIARASASAVETEVVQLSRYLGEMHKSKTLDLYVQRRRAEVLSESRAVFVKRAS
jgi:regulator of protease activity HflC (stomatin/prohibitin superfamily)